MQKLAYLVGKDDLEHVDVSVHPPFTDIRSGADRHRRRQAAVRRSAPSTATGRTRARSPARCRRRSWPSSTSHYVIVGHCERRELFGETDEMVAKKVGRDPAARHDADRLRRRDARRARGGRDRGQGARAGARRARWPSAAEQVAALVIAYEPIWAIGTGRTATPTTPRQCARRSAPAWPRSAAPRRGDAVRIQYGGSVKSSNIAELMAQPDIDGALVGGASLDPDEFARICKLGV